MLSWVLGVGWLCVEVRGGEVAADGQGHEILAGGKRLQPVGPSVGRSRLDSTLSTLTLHVAHNYLLLGTRST